MRNNIISGSDAQAVNFREICIGKIAPGILYRSSHPIKDDEQEKVISLLASSARIATVLNLSDISSQMKAKAFLAPWYNKLLKNDRVVALEMDFCNASASFNKKMKKGLQFITITEGPWLIHCHAGIDRTGFVAMVLEAFMGATLDEIINDYLLSFNSGFNSSIYDSSHKADSLVVMQLLSVMGGSQIITNENLQSIAENYLRNTIGLSAEEIDLLRKKLGQI